MNKAKYLAEIINSLEDASEEEDEELLEILNEEAESLKDTILEAFV